MGGKAKPTKHTAREIAGKVAEANCNKGGGAAGVDDRKGGKTGHSKYQCPHCMTPVPDLKTMKAHHESKHDKIPYDESVYVDMHAANGGVTTTGVAIRGSTKK